MISIVVPLYNKEKRVQDVLRAVLNQTYQNFEIVIVDDGSKDNSVAKVRELDDARIRIIRQKKSGVSAARNRGIAEARGEYIAFLDADDIWEPFHLSDIVHLIETYPECSVYATKYRFEDEFKKTWPIIIRNLPFEGECGVMNNYFDVARCSDPPLWSSAVCAKSTAFQDNACLFPEGTTSGEDLLVWANLAARHKVAYSTRVSAIYYTPTTGPTGIMPSDVETTKDVVGTTLEALHRQFPDKGINLYIAFWYKMRGCINLPRHHRKAAFSCALKSLRYNPRLLKSWALIALCPMPMKLIRRFVKL